MKHSPSVASSSRSFGQGRGLLQILRLLSPHSLLNTHHHHGRQQGIVSSSPRNSSVSLTSFVGSTDPAGLQVRTGGFLGALVPSVSSFPAATARPAPGSSGRDTSLPSRVGDATTKHLFVDGTIAVGAVINDGGASIQRGGASTSSGALSFATDTVPGGAPAGGVVNDGGGALM